MKFNNKRIVIGVSIVVIVVGLFITTRKLGGSPTRAPINSPKFVVYGTEWCGYTTKQRKHLDGKYGAGSHEFVDCDKGNCPGVEAFPVTKTPSGEMVSGFNTEL